MCRKGLCKLLMFPRCLALFNPLGSDLAGDLRDTNQPHGDPVTWYLRILRITVGNKLRYFWRPLVGYLQLIYLKISQIDHLGAYSQMRSYLNDGIFDHKGW